MVIDNWFVKEIGNLLFGVVFVMFGYNIFDCDWISLCWGYRFCDDVDNIVYCFGFIEWWYWVVYDFDLFNGWCWGDIILIYIVWFVGMWFLCVLMFVINKD